MKGDSDWRVWWDARNAALESTFGVMDDLVGHAVIPFETGAELGGSADIVYFKHYVRGSVYVTAELIGRDEQIQNALGNYELAICHRTEEDGLWGENLISKLSYHTLDAEIEPNETMSLGPSVPKESTIAAFLFLEFGRFRICGRDAGVLLCLGITADELALCRAGRRKDVELALKNNGIFPFTDLFRQSVIGIGRA
jgi:hypothetical protein